MIFIDINDIVIIEKPKASFEKFGEYMGRVLFTDMIVASDIIQFELGKKYDANKYIFTPIERIDLEFFRCKVDIIYE